MEIKKIARFVVPIATVGVGAYILWKFITKPPKKEKGEIKKMWVKGEQVWP